MNDKPLSRATNNSGVVTLAANPDVARPNYVECQQATVTPRMLGMLGDDGRPIAAGRIDGQCGISSVAEH
jgi:hypothetical protein